MPQALDEISRRIAQKEIEREAIKREGDKEKVKTIEKELATMREEEKEYTAKWQAEKELINRIQQNKIDIEQLNFEADRAEREATTPKWPRSATRVCSRRRRRTPTSRSSSR